MLSLYLEKARQWKRIGHDLAIRVGYMYKIRFPVFHLHESYVIKVEIDLIGEHDDNVAIAQKFMKRLVRRALLFHMWNAVAAIAHLHHADLVIGVGILHRRVIVSVASQMVEGLRLEASPAEILGHILQMSAIDIVHDPVDT